MTEERERLLEARNRNSRSNSDIEDGFDTLEDDSVADYEKAITAAEYGKFHWWFLWVCGWANASDAIEVLCISFLLPAAECDLQLTSADKGWLSAILFVGMLLGGFIWGNLGDSYGRKHVLITAMFVNAFCGFASSFSQEKATFFVFRFLSGLGVGGSIPIVWSYFAEFQPKNKRGNMLSFLATFWMVGNVTVAGIAWLIIPHEDLGYNTDDPDEFEYNSWRIFTLVCGFPALFVAIGLYWFPESPKYLLSKGREAEALDVFAKIYAKNTGNPKSSYPITRIISSSGVGDRESRRQPFGQLMKEASKNIYALFTGYTKKAMLFMLYINFAIQFGYYGLWLWFPELFSKLENYEEKYPNSTDKLSVCEISEFQADESDVPCPDGWEPPGSDVFINSFIISLCALPGNVWTIVHMDKLGRKFFLVLSMTLSGLCAFLIYLVKSSLANFLVSCAFGLVSNMGFNSLDCLGIELFPTHLRSTAMSITLVAARLGAILGNLAFGYLVDTNCAVPILLVAALLISGGLVSLVLPNTTRTPLA